MGSNSALKSSVWITIGNFSRQFGAIISQLFLARLLDPSDYGIIATAYIFWSFSILFTQFSSGTFILYKGIEDRRYLDTSFTITLIVGGFFSLILSVFSPLISSFFNEPNLRWLLCVYAFNLLLAGIFYTYESILMRQSRYRNVAVIALTATFFRLVVTVASAFYNLGYWSFALGDIAFWIVSICMVMYQSKILLRLRIFKEVSKEIITFSSGTIGSSLGSYFVNNLDNAIVSKMLGVVSLGYYNLSYQLTTSLSKVVMPVVERLGLPTFSKLSGDHERRKALSSVIKDLAYLLTPVYALLMLSIDESTIALVFGEQWSSAAVLVPWLLVISYTRVLNLVLKTINSAQGAPWINARVSLRSVPFVVIGFILGAKYGGTLGVAIAGFITLGIGTTIYWWLLSCQVFSWPIKELVLPMVKPIVVAALAVGVSMLLPIVVKQIFFIFIYVLAIRFLSPNYFCQYYKISARVAVGFKKKVFK